MLLKVPLPKGLVGANYYHTWEHLTLILSFDEEYMYLQPHSATYLFTLEEEVS